MMNTFSQASQADGLSTNKLRERRLNGTYTVERVVQFAHLHTEGESVQQDVVESTGFL